MPKPPMPSASWKSRKYQRIVSHRQRPQRLLCMTELWIRLLVFLSSSSGTVIPGTSSSNFTSADVVLVYFIRKGGKFHDLQDNNTLCCAGVVKASVQNIGRSYPGSERAAKSRTSMGICIKRITTEVQREQQSQEPPSKRIKPKLS